MVNRKRRANPEPDSAQKKLNDYQTPVRNGKPRKQLPEYIVKLDALTNGEFLRSFGDLDYDHTTNTVRVASKTLAKIKDEANERWTEFGINVYNFAVKARDAIGPHSSTAIQVRDTAGTKAISLVDSTKAAPLVIYDPCLADSDLFVYNQTGDYRKKMAKVGNFFMGVLINEEEKRKKKQRFEDEMKKTQQIVSQYGSVNQKLVSMYTNFLEFICPELDRFSIPPEIKDEMRNSDKEDLFYLSEEKPELNVSISRFGTLYYAKNKAGYKLLEMYSKLKRWADDGILWNDQNVKNACKKITRFLRNDYEPSSITMVDKGFAQNLGLDASRLIPIGGNHYYVVGFSLPR